MKKTVLKICCSQWKNASRDKRELSVCRDLGMNVLVVAKGESIGKEVAHDVVDGFHVIRLSTRPFGAKLPNFINRIAAILTWAHYAKGLRVDMISGHDIDGLFIGWLSTVLVPKKKKPKLVYDSHEFELGRNCKRSRMATFFVKHLEKFLIKRCAFAIMVNDSIADEVQRIHGLKQRPLVVRSTPDNWLVDPDVCKEKRQELLGKFGGKVSFLVMYHGAISDGRGIEPLIESIAPYTDVGFVILGNVGKSVYTKQLAMKADQLGVTDRVQFQEAVSIETLWQYLGAADVSIATIEPVAKSYYYSLPNKFFESIQALTPVIASNLPEMKRLVQEYRIGLTCNPNDIGEIRECIDRMRNDQEFYAACKKNLVRAKAELCWEKEKKALVNAYQAI